MEFTAMFRLVPYVVVTFLSFLVSNHVGDAKRDGNLYCGACIALVDEMNWEIGKVDSKSTIQVGSFRVDSRGNQGLREIPLARSELHLTELLEDVCRHTSNYAKSTGTDGSISYIRTSRHDGSSVSLSNVQISGDIHSKLKYACETLIEEHEDELLAAFRSDHDDIEQHLCVDTMGVCDSQDIADQRRVMDGAVSAATTDQANKDDDENAGKSDDDDVTAADDDSTDASDREDL